MADVAEALEIVMGANGRSMDAGRIKTVALIVLSQSWTKAQLRAAARCLASSARVRDHLRFGGTITPADFEELRAGDEATIGEGEDKRVIVTRSGYALQVARARLYDYAEAMGLWRAAGEPGVFSTDGGRHANGMFESVRIVGDREGQDRVLWRFA